MTNELSQQRTNNDNLLGRVAIWTLGGAIANLRSSKLAACAILGPISEHLLNYKIEDVLAEALRKHEERKRQERVRQALQAWVDSTKLLPVNTVAQTQTTAPSVLNTVQPVELDTDTKWLKVIPHPSVVLILGKRGSGKSALGYRILELFKYSATPYVLGVPARAGKLLPEWIGVEEDLDAIPVGSIVLIDEAYLAYHSRESLKPESKKVSRIVNLSRQREQTLIFVSQEARQIDKNIASQANIIVFKELSILQLKFDRPELSDIAAKAKEAFSTITSEKPKWSYVYSPDADFIGLVENSLPTFWSSRLSRAFANSHTATTTRTPKTMTRTEKTAKAKELHRGGMSYRQIAAILNVNEGTAYNYVNDYPYKK